MSMTTSNPFPLTKVNAVIPRVHSPERVTGYLGFELKQCQPVCLIIPTSHEGEQQATARKKKKSMHTVTEG